MWDTMAHKIARANNLDMKKDHNRIREIATKNVITNFMKDNLKMSQKDRDSIRIRSIYSCKKETTPIIYIQCEDTEDISLITSHVSNLPTNQDKNAPSVVTHIPQVLFKRYQYCQKILYKLRKSQKGKIQTNIRLGRLDFQLRHKVKGDPTPCKLIPTLKNPQGCTQTRTGPTQG